MTMIEKIDAAANAIREACGEAENADWREKKVYTRRKLCYNEEKTGGDAS